VDNIKIDLREMGWDGMDWIDLAQDKDQWRALVNMAMNVITSINNSSSIDSQYIEIEICVYWNLRSF
jgi:hypothetical protein